ncbi:hypothetical protein QTO34_016817 [Cnephaeus nilssonii]|uniref:Uncharacterized protein n=1 Tax=Cnephaeus nilssonii TaxID=3371016 RepID=A0AA40I338_CNENI|nr:hypothetical protein QTO34_016817 [Eptesicus nilssonii]
MQGSQLTTIAQRLQRSGSKPTKQWQRQAQQGQDEQEQQAGVAGGIGLPLLAQSPQAMPRDPTVHTYLIQSLALPRPRPKASSPWHGTSSWLRSPRSAPGQGLKLLFEARALGRDPQLAQSPGSTHGQGSKPLAKAWTLGRDPQLAPITRLCPSGQGFKPLAKARALGTQDVQFAEWRDLQVIVLDMQPLLMPSHRGPGQGAQHIGASTTISGAPHKHVDSMSNLWRTGQAQTDQRRQHDPDGASGLLEVSLGHRHCFPSLDAPQGRNNIKAAASLMALNYPPLLTRLPPIALPCGLIAPNCPPCQPDAPNSPRAEPTCGGHLVVAILSAAYQSSSGHQFQQVQLGGGYSPLPRLQYSSCLDLWLWGRWCSRVAVISPVHGHSPSLGRTTGCRVKSLPTHVCLKIV